MADLAISGLTELTTPPAADDLYPIVDDSDTTDAGTGTTKKIRADTAQARALNAQTISYTLVANDAVSLVQMTSVTPIIVTIPLNATVPFPVGTEIPVVNRGAGLVQIQITATGTLVPGIAEIGQNDRANLVKIATNTWIVTIEYGQSYPAVWLLASDPEPVTIPNQTWTTIDWETPIIEQGGPNLWDAADPDIINLGKAGTWHSIVIITWAAHPTGLRGSRIMGVDSGFKLDEDMRVACNKVNESTRNISYGPVGPGEGAGARQRVQVYQSSGGNLDVVRDGIVGPQWMTYWTPG